MKRINIVILGLCNPKIKIKILMKKEKYLIFVKILLYYMGKLLAINKINGNLKE